VEGPEPRPQGLTEEEKQKLKDYAAKAMALMVERRNTMRQKLSRSPDPVVLRHAGVTTNLGVHMLYANECLTAMKLFQESLQTLMYVEGDSQSGLPSKERQEQMEKLHALFSTGMLTEQSRQVLVEGVKSLYHLVADDNVMKHLPGTPKPGMKHDSCVDNSIPGLFPQDSKFKSGHTRYPLSFGEPFKINLYSPPGDNTIDFQQFTIPLYQCSKATMYNMGLIHYHWGSADSAVQFFDLAASLSHKKPQTDALSFDPVVLACLNNIAQINLQYRRPVDAMEMLSDALTRGNAALAKLYASNSQSVSPNSSSSSICSDEPTDNPNDICRTLRLRKKLSRTLLNMGHVHFYNCNYDAAITTCKDALRLMHTNMDDPEVAAMWYNMAVLDFHKGEKMDSLKHLDKFLEMSRLLQGPDSTQIAEALHRRGQILYEIGDLYQCIKPLNEALTIRRQKYGADHPLAAETLFALGKAYLAREEFEFALNAYYQCLAIQRKTSPDEEISFDVAQTLLDIGRAHHAQGNFKEALTVYREASQLTKRFFGERHAFVARIENIIGTLCLECGLVEESVAAFKEAAEIRQEQGLPVNMNVAADEFASSRRNTNDVAPPA
jgi:tetratricopeptide (TPR) repeat protein